MKKVTALVMLVFVVFSCSQKYYEKMYKKSYTVDEVISINEKILKAENIAEKKIYSQSLENSIIEAKDATVRNIIESQYVDYDFCVVADMEHENGKIQLNIFSKNVRLISQLKTDQSKISIIGEFGRMYKLFDDYYLKIDIQQASISVKK